MSKKQGMGNAVRGNVHWQKWARGEVLPHGDGIFHYQILPELIDLWGMNIKTTVPARKN